jgi:hypothetical protein
MLTRADLAAAMATAFAHCRPGGLVILEPDETTETFRPSTDHGGSDGEDGRAVRFLEWSWDPDPADEQISVEYAFLLRDADGSVRVEHETHANGLFSRDVWLALLGDAGFETWSVMEETDEDRPMRELFLGRKPA